MLVGKYSGRRASRDGIKICLAFIVCSAAARGFYVRRAYVVITPRPTLTPVGFRTAKPISLQLSPPTDSDVPPALHRRPRSKSYEKTFVIESISDRVIMNIIHQAETTYDSITTTIMADLYLVAG